VIAALSSWHEQHEAAGAALDAVEALPAHVLLESYSVLTRLPSGLAVAPELAARVIASRFGGPPLQLDAPGRAQLVATLARSGVLGGAAYDGLVALEAAAHDQTLATLDTRAQATYRRLGAAFTVIGG
jgi:hypothetical protein